MTTKEIADEIRMNQQDNQEIRNQINAHRKEAIELLKDDRFYTAMHEIKEAIYLAKKIELQQ